MKTVFQHTDTTCTHPGYVSISKQDNGLFTVDVRSRAAQSISRLNMSEVELVSMAEELLAAFQKPDPDKSVPLSNKRKGSAGTGEI
jgi:hypothetical protein